MKINNTVALLALLAVTACKRESINQPQTSIKANVRSALTNGTGGSYNDMTLLARQPGENFDTYIGNWQGISIKITGPLSYDNQKYPNLVNGVPLTDASINSNTGNASISSQNTGPDGNVFGGAQGLLSGTNFNQFQSDLDSYYGALDTYFKSGLNGSQPLIQTYVKDSYSNPTSFKVITGKVIRVTTGSNVALASIDYPLPASPPLSEANINVDIVDKNNSAIIYHLVGIKGNFTTAYKGSVVNGQPVYDFNTTFHITGSYVHTTTGTGIYHYWGTVTRADGTPDTFNITADLS